MGKGLFSFSNVVLPLLCGAVIYWIFRPDAIVSKWISSVFGSCPVRVSSFAFHNSGLLAFCNNHLPDMLWAYSFTALTTIILEHEKTILSVSASFTFMTELLQIPGILPGVFDWIDIVLEWTACALAVLILMWDKTIGGDFNEK
jgi:hypothetical protein